MKLTTAACSLFLAMLAPAAMAQGDDSAIVVKGNIKLTLDSGDAENYDVTASTDDEDQCTSRPDGVAVVTDLEVTSEAENPEDNDLSCVFYSAEKCEGAYFLLGPGKPFHFNREFKVGSWGCQVQYF